MTTWFTEDSTLPMITGVILVIILLGLAVHSRERLVIYIALAVGILTGATVICERMIVTEQEQVMQCVYELASAVQANDSQTVASFISRTRQDTIDHAIAEMQRYDFDRCRIIGKNYFIPTAEGRKTAEISFIVSVGVRIDGSAQTLQGQRKVILYFEKQPDGKWRVVDYSHADPRGNLTI